MALTSFSDNKVVAFPAVATGGLQYGVDEVATTMISAIKSHYNYKSYHSLCPRKIYLVIYPGFHQCYQVSILVK